MRNILVKLIGWEATILHADPCAYDRWRWLKRHLLPGTLRTLDAGCGNGALTMYASKIGNESVGASFDKEKNQMAGFRANILGIKNIKFIDGDLKDLDKIQERLGRFDQIICFETIEHIADDRKLIKDLSDMLKPSGRLILTTPYRHSRELRWLQPSELENGGHIRRGYTHPEIRRLFKENGLEVQAEDYISGFISQQLTRLMFFLNDTIGKTASWVIIFPLRLLQVLDLPFTRLLGYPRLSVGVMGVKAR